MTAHVCGRMTTYGLPCSRVAYSGRYCWQHQALCMWCGFRENMTIHYWSAHPELHDFVDPGGHTEGDE